MPETNGKFLWVDLTVPEAEPVRNFYAAVVGWTWEGTDMGGYEDYSVKTPAGAYIGLYGKE